MGTEQPTTKSEGLETDAAASEQAGVAPDGVETESESAEQDAGGAYELQIADLNNRLLRTQADFDNFRRRARQEKEELLQFGVSRLIGALLPTVDNFERALAAADATGGNDNLIKGIDMVRRELLATLEKEGLRAMEAVGQPFDPSLHEAVMQVEDATQPAGYVVEEMQRGYFLKEKVLRPAMVKVSQ